MNEIKVINFIRSIIFIKYLDQSIQECQVLNYILGLTISEAKIVILLLFWVGGWWVGEIENKDQLSPTEVEIRTEFGNIQGCLMVKAK